MTKKKPQKKTKNVTKRQKYTFNFSRKELFLWLGAAFLALVWMFTLGVIVGRGLSPVQFDIEKLKKELIALKEEASKKTKAQVWSQGKSSPDVEHLGFYEVLTDKKEEARLKSLSETRGKDSRALETKTAVVNKDKLWAKRATSAKRTEKGSFTLQVASLKDKLKADEMARILENKGYDAYVIATRVTDKETFHRVRVGHFADRDDAMKMASRLKGDAFESLLIQE
jgi:cell division protein FtsN